MNYRRSYELTAPGSAAVFHPYAEDSGTRVDGAAFSFSACKHHGERAEELGVILDAEGTLQIGRGEAALEEELEQLALAPPAALDEPPD